MDERERGVGRNEGVFREVNERIESLNRGIAAISNRTMHVVCECSDLTCAEQLAIDVEAYERVRADGACFIVLPGTKTRRSSAWSSVQRPTTSCARTPARPSTPPRRPTRAGL